MRAAKSERGGNSDKQGCCLLSRMATHCRWEEAAAAAATIANHHRSLRVGAKVTATAAAPAPPSLPAPSRSHSLCLSLSLARLIN